jgi:hypothetical protein
VKLLLIEIVFFHAGVIPVLPVSCHRKKDCRFSELLPGKSQMIFRRVPGKGDRVQEISKILKRSPGGGLPGDPDKGSD